MFIYIKMRGYDPKNDFVLCLPKDAHVDVLSFWTVLGFLIDSVNPDTIDSYYSPNTIFEINGVRFDIKAHALTMNINNQ